MMKYVKAVLAALGLIITALTAALADNVIGIDEWQALAAAAVEGILIVLAVIRVPNARYVDIDTLSRVNRREVEQELLGQGRRL